MVTALRRKPASTSDGRGGTIRTYITGFGDQSHSQLDHAPMFWQGKQYSAAPAAYGARGRARTCGPMLVRHMLFQLSYADRWWRW